MQPSFFVLGLRAKGRGGTLMFFGGISLTYVLWQVVKIVLVFVLARLALVVSQKVTTHWLMQKEKGQKATTATRTLIALINSVLFYVVYGLFFLTLLELIHVPIASLLAGAGIVGLAIGFGARNLVSDVISGFFLLFENQYGVGETVQIAGISGTVQEIGLRITKLKGFNGEHHFIPNGSITQVTNYSRGHSSLSISVSLSLQADMTETEKVIRNLVDQIPKIYPETGQASYLGITQINPTDAVYTVSLQIPPSQAGTIGNWFRREILLAFQKINPWPQTQISLAKVEGE